MDKYFTFKFYTEFVIPIVIVGILFTIWLILTVVNSMKWNRKIALLKKYGYERYLHGVASVGNGAFYAWRKHNHSVTEREINHMTCKELKTAILNADMDEENKDDTN